MEKKQLHTERGDIVYWIHKKQSSEKAIMFTHGVTADHTLFSRQIAYFSKDYTVILWDMPLHGESRPYKNFTFENVANDMKNILDEEEITHIAMAGQSAGGYAVQAFLLQYPNMVDAFIAIDSSPFGRKYYSSMDLFLVKHYKGIAKLYPYHTYCKQASKAAAYTKEAQESFYDCLIRLGKDGMLEAADAVYQDFSNYDEVDIKCPVLLLLGEYDKTGYVRKYNQKWNKEKGYPLEIIPKSAHNSNQDNYRFFNQVVDGFLKENVYH
ncbi:beta-ketoadipate enol-lactone hydrolase [Lachnospiraceae bacterium KM106-2]|nr:beta-ketoadipate enol-lactone hydrolase [Lachnospiraceae bacterium KM106-2]